MNQIDVPKPARDPSLDDGGFLIPRSGKCRLGTELAVQIISPLKSESASLSNEHPCFEGRRCSDAQGVSFSRGLHLP